MLEKIIIIVKAGCADQFENIYEYNNNNTLDLIN